MRKGKSDTEESETRQQENKQIRILDLLLQDFHNDCGVWRVFQQPAPPSTDTKDFCLHLPETQQSQQTKHQPFTNAGEWWKLS